MTQAVCEDAGIIQRVIAEDKAWAEAADRGCHRLPKGQVCAVDACPVCRPLAFRTKFPPIAALGAAPLTVCPAAEALRERHLRLERVRAIPRILP